MIVVVRDVLFQKQMPMHAIHGAEVLYMFDDRKSNMFGRITSNHMLPLEPLGIGY